MLIYFFTTVFKSLKTRTYKYNFRNLMCYITPPPSCRSCWTPPTSFWRGWSWVAPQALGASTLGCTSCACVPTGASSSQRPAGTAGLLGIYVNLRDSRNDSHLTRHGNHGNTLRLWTVWRVWHKCWIKTLKWIQRLLGDGWIWAWRLS